MLNKKEVKDIQSLAHKKYRSETNLFVAEGPKIVSEFLKTLPDRIEKIYATPGWITSHADSLHRLSVISVKEEDLARISLLTTPNQVLAVVKQLKTVKPPYSGFVLCLDAIQDPGNFGTILRTADWFGVYQVVCSPGCADLYNPKVVQSTMASLARVNVFYDLEETWLQNSQLPVYAAVLGGSSLYQEPKIREGILIIGNESKGVRSEWVNLASKHITIPGRGVAESLNAAVATGIILSHLLG